MEYEICIYKGRQWGIFAKKSRCFVMFGPKKVLEKRLKELNKKEV